MTPRSIAGGLSRRARGLSRRLSLSARLLLAVTGVALVALIAADVATYSALRSSLFAQADQSLGAVQGPLVNVLDSGRPIQEDTVASLAPGMFVEIVSPGGQIVAEIPAVVQGGEQYEPTLSAGDLEMPTAATPAPLPGGGGTGPFPGAPGNYGAPGAARYLTEHASQGNGPLFRVRVSPLVNGYELVLATPLTSTSSTLHRLVAIEILVTLAALAAAIALGAFTVRIGLRPLGQVRSTAEAISRGGDLSRRAAEDGTPGEVRQLAHAFNTMIGHIQQAFSERDATEGELRDSEERMRRFLADASHELRTPLAAVSAYAELFERGAQKRPDDLARVMAGIRSESSRMALLVEDLMLLARLDDGRPLARSSVELVALCSRAVDAASAVGPQWPLGLLAAEPVEVVGDPDRLRQVVDNLLSNVRAHTPAGTSAKVAVRRQGGQAVIEVTDAGPGMSAADASHAFERFYRADTSRFHDAVSQGAGSGLGLSIVAAIAKAHGGTVSVATELGLGTTFTVSIPINQSGAATPPVERPSGRDHAPEFSARRPMAPTGDPPPSG